MMQTTKILAILFLNTIIAYSAISQEVLSNWKLDRESEDIRISYRHLLVGDTLETRQMRITFYIEAMPDKLIPMFYDADLLSEWSAGTKECKVLQYDTNTWSIYNLFDIPWPFKQKDLITEYRMIRSDSKVNLYMSGKPKLLPRFEGISRIEKYEGKWEFAPMGQGKTKVELTTISFTKPSMPRFIQDPILQNVFIDSINMLKELIAAQEPRRVLACE